jgi:hypothetical protein
MNDIETLKQMDLEIKKSIDDINRLTDKSNNRFDASIIQLILFMVTLLLGYGCIVYLPVLILSFLTYCWYEITKFNRDTAFLSHKSLIVFYKTSGILKENNKHILQKYEIRL